MGKESNMGKSNQAIFRSMEVMKITFIATVLNEAENIKIFLDSILSQTEKPDEVIIIDGNSSDSTNKTLKDFSVKFKKLNIKYLTGVVPGNRAMGRNKAIELSSCDLIVCSDAGCILDKDWVKNITRPFKNKNADVVAGYYKGLAGSMFQKCLIPYVLVMPDRVDPYKFLPATRSMAFTKNIWKKVHGFPEKYSNNEDYVFARKLREIGAKIIFVNDALVYWMPVRNLAQAYNMFFRFAKGDTESKILRPKVILINVRYVLGILLLLLAIINKDITLFFSALLLLYIAWAIVKNYKYVNSYKAIAILPILQFVSDIAVIGGTLAGLINIWGIKKTQ
jgi:glycosyltransferase involved in cell wall biosynthesis